MLYFLANFFFKIAIPKFGNSFQSLKSLNLFEVFLASNFDSLTHSLIVCVCMCLQVMCFVWGGAMLLVLGFF